MSKQTPSPPQQEANDLEGQLKRTSTYKNPINNLPNSEKSY